MAWQPWLPKEVYTFSLHAMASVAPMEAMATMINKRIYEMTMNFSKDGFTGCPLILWTFFFPFLSLQSSLDKTFGHFCDAHKILISKM